MLAKDKVIFLQLSDNSSEPFAPGSIHCVAGNSIGVTVMDVRDDPEGARPAVPDVLRVGKTSQLLYDHDGQFVKRGVRRIVPELPGGDDCQPKLGLPLIWLELLTPPVASDRRECYRVPANIKGLRASFGRDDACELTDASVMGLGVASREHHKEGDLVDVSIFFEDVKAIGSVSVQSATVYRPGWYRYGVLCVEADFQREVQELTMEIQRVRLRRMNRMETAALP